LANHSILIADDHPMVRRALREALVEMLGEGVQLEEVGSVPEARQVLARIHVDLLMLDLNMPGMDGMLGLNALRAEFPAIPILVVSGIEDPVVVRQTMEFGASGFLPKSAPFASIGEAVGSLLAGDLWFPAGLESSTEPRDEELAARIAEFTPQQHRVFMLLAQGKLNKEIGYELAVTEATVKTHVSRILAKLGVNSRTQAALVGQRLGKSALVREQTR
jgi:DNA-binding NarL/FixJ family response regulator